MSVVPEGSSRSSHADAPAAARLARLFATPTGVLVIVPLLVISVGVVVMLLGRRATSDASGSMARQQLAAQAKAVQHEVAFALDQADALLVKLRALADGAMPIEQVAPRMHALHVGRPGVANLSIGFPDGSLRGTFVASGEIDVQESRIGDRDTTRINYRVADGRTERTDTQHTDYDVRTRPHYMLALAKRTRVWGAPRTYFTSHTTGVTCTEPIFAADGSVRAVADVAFDVGALSAFIVRPPLVGARTVVFARDGTILAFPTAPVPEVAMRQNRLLRHEDYRDPALEALFAEIGREGGPSEQRFLQLHAPDGDYLASLAPVGGTRAGVAEPLDWYLATLVPEATLLGATKRLERQSVLVSAGALAIAMGVALMFAWNLVRMRRAVGVARAQARNAEARARELGSYRLVGKLGTGGMGEVWRAEHRLLARQAAIKLARPDALRDPAIAQKVRERFRREAQTLAAMRSRHTIALYDFGVTDDGTLFFVMELLDGVDLDRLVRAHGPLPAARVIELLVQACQSLAEAHDAGLLHRDIKPANLFVSRAADEVDVIKVLDFGIVRSIDEGIDPIDIVALPLPEEAPVRPSQLTQHGMVVGTPGYIAPEQALGATIDPRADIYALACVAWWLLVGSEVFPRTDEVSAIRSHAHDPVPSLRDRMPPSHWLPVELEQLIYACLAKRPDQRPDDARALARQLRAIAIPAEHAWTEADAQRWWLDHLPARDAGASTDDANVRLLVPRHLEANEAETVEQRPR